MTLMMTTTMVNDECSENSEVTASNQLEKMSLAATTQTSREEVSRHRAVQGLLQVPTGSSRKALGS